MYKKKKDLAKEYSIGLSTTSAIINLIKKELGKRYPADAVIHTGNIIRVEENAFHDAFCNRDLIELGIAPKIKTRKMA